MRDGVSGGLAGKARWSHRRKRASRRYHQQAVAEVMEPEQSTFSWKLERPIPIGHRSEFLPSAEPAADIVPATSETQLELPLTKPDGVRTQWSEEPKATRRRRGMASAVEQAGRAAGEPGQAGTAPRRRPRGTPAERPQTVSLGGFLYGVILGSAAAAMVLVVLMAVFK